MDQPSVITVHQPQVTGDTVWFRWDGDDGLPQPPEGGLFYRFEGIDLEQFSTELWLEIFLSLRLHAWKRTRLPIELRLPVPLPRPSIAFWTSYHHAENVVVSSAAANDTYSPWSGTARSPEERHEAAVFFGGGRDSLVGACLLGEVLGREEVLLIQCVDPDQPTQHARDRRAARMEALSLGPMRDQLGFPVQRVWTNLRSLALAQGGKPFESHAEQYSAAFLPVLLAHGVRLSTCGFPWNQHIIRMDPAGPIFRSPRSRPEVLQLQSLHYQRTLGFDHRLIHVNMALNGCAAFDILHQRYPEAFDFIFTCPGSTKPIRWCQNCRRCARHAWHCLANGVVSKDFDLDFVMTSSDWILAMMEAISTLKTIDLDDYGPAFRGKKLVTAYDYPLMCYEFYRADPQFAASELSEDGMGNFTVMKALYGNKPVPYLAESPAQAYEFMPEPLAGQLRGIVGQYLRVTPQFSSSPFTAEGPAKGPFDLPLDLEFLNLPHLQMTASSGADRKSGPGSS